jgi:hypothetical protein
MKTEGKVRQQLKQVAFRHLKHEIESSQKRLSHNCIFNTKGSNPGFASQCTQISNFLKMCDSRINPQVCQKCTLFVTTRDPDMVKSEFKELMQQEKSSIAEKYPDIAALRWVLEDEVPEDLTEGIETVSVGPPKKSFWKRLFRRA